YAWSGCAEVRSIARSIQSDSDHRPHHQIRRRQPQSRFCSGRVRLSDQTFSTRSVAGTRFAFAESTMSNSGRSFFDQFLDDYFSEAEEHLTAAKTHLLSLEKADASTGVDQNVLDELLRSFHSLKGLSAMVGLDEATQLSHRIEDYLRELKEPSAVPTADGLERVSAAINAIEQVVNARRRSEPIPDIGMVLAHLDAAIEEA